MIIPDEVKRLILLGVPSVPYLEAMLLFRANPDSPLSEADLARRLYLPEAVGSQLIGELASARVVRANDGGSWRYAPEGELRDRIDQLARAYSTNLIGVAQLIHSKTWRTCTTSCASSHTRSSSRRSSGRTAGEGRSRVRRAPADELAPTR